MRKEYYEIIEHTADIGIRVKADDLAGLFSKAAAAMFDIIVEKKEGNKGIPFLKEKRGDSQFKIKLTADNLEELFVTWLSELLYLFSVREVVPWDFKINNLDETNLAAVVLAESIAHYRVKTEIKAVTYHELEVKKVDSEWQGKVIFDV
ncbi:MAG: archease [Candidatus Omnitrophota bacterium]